MEYLRWIRDMVKVVTGWALPNIHKNPNACAYLYFCGTYSSHLNGRGVDLCLEPKYDILLLLIILVSLDLLLLNVLAALDTSFIPLLISKE